MAVFTYLREVPEVLRQGVALREFVVDGSIIRNLANGQIVGHLQAVGSYPLRLMDGAFPFDPLNSALSGVEIVQNVKILDGMEWLKDAMQAQLGMQGSNLLLSAFGIVQNEQIKSRLTDISDGLAIVQAMQVAEMLVSGLAMGAGILNQVAMRRRLATIVKGIEGLGHKLDHARQEDRRRRTASLFHQLDGQIAIADSLSSRRRPDFAAAASEAQFSSVIARLVEEFQSRIDDLPSERAAAAAAVAEARGIAKAIQLGRQAHLQALFEIDEPETVSHFARHQSREARKEAWIVEPAEVIIRTDGRGKDAASVETATRALIGQLILLVGDLTMSARTTLSTGLLADKISQNGWSSRAYLAEARSADGDTIMMLSEPRGS